MSKETLEWLNANVLIGFTDDREHWAGQGYASARGEDQLIRPWFAQEGYDGGYIGPVPVDAVRERLFAWEAIEGPLSATVPCDITEADSMDAEGNPFRNIVLPDHKAIMRSDNDFIMGVFKQGYTVHQYDEWLIENVASILDDDVQIDSAGLLMGGGVAWVSVSMPEVLSTSADFAFRPRILSFTSHNGKHSTTYMRSVSAPVCDNSLAAEIAGGNGHKVRIKHSANSGLKIAGARDALGILYQQADEVATFFEKLTEWEVTNKQFKAILDSIEPMPDPVTGDGGKVTNQRAITMADNRRLVITKLYVEDHRAAPWKGTALGVLQAFNTFDQQERSVNGQRIERQMVATLDGSVGKYDREVLDMVGRHTGHHLDELVPA